MLQRRSVQQYLRASSCIRNLQSSRPFSTGVDTHPKAPSAPTQQSPRNRRQGKQPSLTGGGAPKSKIHSRGSKTGAGHEKTSEKRLLHPHVLSARLIKICDDDQLNTAIDTLKNLPLDAQNVAVWNTLIRETLKAKRYQLAYQLYVDVCPLIALSRHCPDDSALDETSRLRSKHKNVYDDVCRIHGDGTVVITYETAPAHAHFV